ncbi:hypothetical protein F2Q70_00023906 [Brassica cretica]|uniref:Uncharacterized protein n=1 Tax=Brassica cretica TaxID=69181 RepID=A0A8S9GU55_BRACR|nr:hypothetical protein F2Q70_00023906 [Brassica cretica]
MDMKKLLKVVFFWITYLTFSLSMATYHGCGPCGEVSGNKFGNYKNKVKFSLGRKLVSGPSRRGCGH